MNYCPKELAKLKSWIVLLLSLYGMTGLAASPLWSISFTTPALAQTQSARQEEAERLLNLCREHLGKEQFESALESCQQALSSHQKINDRSGETKSMTNLGIAYLRSGQSNQGIYTLEKAVKIARDIDEKRVEAIALFQLGLAYISLEQSQQGTEFLQQALTIAEKIGDTDLATGIKQILSSPRKIEADRFLQQGIQEIYISQYREALESSQKALEIYRDIGNRNGEANSLMLLGLAYSSLGEYGKAIDFYQQSLPNTVCLTIKQPMERRQR